MRSMHNAAMCTLSLYDVIGITRHLHIKLKSFPNIAQQLHKKISTWLKFRTGEGRVLKFSSKRQQPNIFNTYHSYLNLGFKLRPPVPEADAVHLEVQLELS